MLIFRNISPVACVLLTTKLDLDSEEDLKAPPSFFKLLERSKWTKVTIHLTLNLLLLLCVHYSSSVIELQSRVFLEQNVHFFWITGFLVWDWKICWNQTGDGNMTVTECHFWLCELFWCLIWLRNGLVLFQSYICSILKAKRSHLWSIRKLLTRFHINCTSLLCL